MRGSRLVAMLGLFSAATVLVWSMAVLLVYSGDASLPAPDVARAATASSVTLQPVASASPTRSIALEH